MAAGKPATGHGGVAAADHRHVHLTPLQSLLTNPDRFLGPVVPDVITVLVPSCAARQNAIEVVHAEVSPAFLTTLKEMLDNAMDQARTDRRLTYIRIGVRGNTFLVENNGSGMSTQLVGQKGSTACGLPIAVACVCTFDFTSKSRARTMGSGGHDSDEDSDGDVSLAGAAGAGGKSKSKNPKTALTAPALSKAKAKAKATVGLSGKNGVGMKGVSGTALAFSLETQDTVLKQTLKATWGPHLSQRKVKVTKWKAAKDVGVTRFTWTPDWDFFKMRHVASETGVPNEDIVALFRNMAWRRAAILTAACDTDPALQGRRIRVQWGEGVPGAGPESTAWSWAVPPWKNVGDIMTSLALARMDDSVPVTPAHIKKHSAPVLRVTEGQTTVWVVPTPYVSMGVVNGMPCDAGTHMSRAWALVRAAVAESWKPKVDKTTPVPPFVAKYGHVTHLSQYFSVGVSTTVSAATYGSQDKSVLKTPAREFWPEALSLPLKTTAARRVLEPAVQAMMRDAATIADASAARAAARVETQADTVLDSGSGRGGQRLVSVPNYTPATLADTRGVQCRLFIAEGESAKNYCMILRGALREGASHMGVYALKGKPQSARRRGAARVRDNVEMSALARILGLTLGKPAPPIAHMRYQSLVVAADMDTDGDHIVGLVYSNLDHLWPSLFKQDPCFVKRYATPLIRTRPGSRVELAFHSVQQMQAHLDTLSPAERKRLHLQHVKGLGQWPRTDIVRQHAPRVAENLVALRHTGAATHALLEKAFGEDTQVRRDFMDEFLPSASVDYTRKEVPFPDWARVELVAYMWAHVLRNLPAMEDGLCPAERKALWVLATHSRWEKTERTATVAGSIVSCTNYAHGEASLQGVVSRLAGSAVGKSNVNVLADEGSFGTRFNPKPAQPRYTQTGRTPLTMALFPAGFTRVVPRAVEEGSLVEAEELPCPIPYIFINGRRDSIGAGYNSVVLPIHTNVLLRVTRGFIDGTEDGKARPKAAVEPGRAESAGAAWPVLLDAAEPHWDGLVSQVSMEPERVVIRGRVRVEAGPRPMALTILDLPPGKWTGAYVENLKEAARKKAPLKGGLVVTSVQDASTDSMVHVHVRVDPGTLAPLLTKTRVSSAPPSALESSLPAELLAPDRFGPSYPALENALGLKITLSRSDLRFVQRSADGSRLQVRTFERPSQYMMLWGEHMLQWYARRLAAERDDARREVLRLENMVRYVCETRAREATGKLNAAGLYGTEAFPTAAARKKLFQTRLPTLARLTREGQLAAELRKSGYNTDTQVTPAPVQAVPIADKEGASAASGAGDADDDADADASSGEHGTFQYLTSIAIAAQTTERVQRLVAKLLRAREQVQALLAATPQLMWRRDLNVLETQLQTYMEGRRALHLCTHHGQDGTAAAGSTSASAHAKPKGTSRGVKRPRASASLAPSAARSPPPKTSAKAPAKPKPKTPAKKSAGAKAKPAAKAKAPAKKPRKA